MRRNPGVYARGAVRHSDHATITLPFWHRVIMNTETQSRTMAIHWRPKCAGLYEPRVIHTGQRSQFFSVGVPGQDAASRIKDLGEAKIVVVSNEKAI